MTTVQREAGKSLVWSKGKIGAKRQRRGDKVSLFVVGSRSPLDFDDYCVRTSSGRGGLCRIRVVQDQELVPALRIRSEDPSQPELGDRLMLPCEVGDSSDEYRTLLL